MSKILEEGQRNLRIMMRRSEGNTRPRLNVMRLKRVKERSKDMPEEVRERKIQDSLTKLKEFIDESSEDQEEFDKQYAKHKSLVDELDVERKEDFWNYLDHNQAKVKREKRDMIEKDCLNDERILQYARNR